MQNDEELADKAYELVAIGISYWQTGDLDCALENYLKALELLKSRGNPIFFIEDLDIIEDLGDIYRTMGNYIKAIKCYENARGPNNLLIGNVYYYNIKDYNNAIKIYVDLLNISADPSYATAAFNLSKMSWKGEGIPQNYINALQWINVAISMTPDNVDFQNTFDKLKNDMTALEIETATLLTIEWLNNRDEVIHKLKNENPWHLLASVTGGEGSI